MGEDKGNYCALYVKEPFTDPGIDVSSAKDFTYYDAIRSWKNEDSSFPFVDSHQNHYIVRESRQKSTRAHIHDELATSKNLILILSKRTKPSDLLIEELTCGVGTMRLPLIIVYPDYKKIPELVDSTTGHLCKDIKKMWLEVPVLKECLRLVPTLHIPFNKECIKAALLDSSYSLGSKHKKGVFYYR